MRDDRHDLLRLWLIDDGLDWHAVTRQTVATLARVELRCFASGNEALAALQHGPAPEVVLMDFFLGDERGDVLTRTWRRAEGASRALIIGHSTSPICSRMIVAAGGDLVLRKRADATGRNPDLAAWLASHLR